MVSDETNSMIVKPCRDELASPQVDWFIPGTCHSSWATFRKSDFSVENAPVPQHPSNKTETQHNGNEECYQL